MLLERLLNNLGLDVEAFATCRVAPGWRLRLPPLDGTTFHYAVDGEGGVGKGGDSPLPLSRGCLAVVPPSLVHTLQCGGPPFAEAGPGGTSVAQSELPDHQAGPADEGGLLVACGRVKVTYQGVQGLFDRLREILVLNFSGDPRMRTTFASLLEEMHRRRPGSRAMISTLMRECLVRVFRELCVQEDCRIPWLSAIEDPELAPALDDMLAHPEHHHTVGSLAATSHMSRSAFARRFRRSMSATPLEYLRGVRLRHAAGLLTKAPSLPIATVAKRSGFASRSQFSRAFRDYFGRSPSEFRT